jgi:hypothetical protein
MRWRRSKDPISDEAKQAQAQATQQAARAEVVGVEAEKQLREAQTIAARLMDIRRRNHFAEAFDIVLGGNR